MSDFEQRFEKANEAVKAQQRAGRMRVLQERREILQRQARIEENLASQAKKRREIFEKLQKSDGTEPHELLTKEYAEFALDFVRFMSQRGMPGATTINLENKKDTPGMRVMPEKHISGYQIGYIYSNSDYSHPKTPLAERPGKIKNVFLCEDGRLRAWEVFYGYTSFTYSGSGATNAVLEEGEYFSTGRHYHGEHTYQDSPIGRNDKSDSPPDWLDRLEAKRTRDAILFRPEWIKELLPEIAAEHIAGSLKT